METLKVVTETSVIDTTTGVLEEKYKVVAPEFMHETLLSDSEDEGGDDLLDHNQYKYMATDELKTTIEHDNKNFDTTNPEQEQLDGYQGYTTERGEIILLNMHSIQFCNDRIISI